MEDITRDWGIVLEKLVAICGIGRLIVIPDGTAKEEEQATFT